MSDIYDDFLENNKVNPFIDFPLHDKEEIKMIQYKDITSNRYYITSEGRVFSTFNNELKELKQRKIKGGYIDSKLSTESKDGKHVTIHRLVATAFADKESNGYNIVNHKDGDKTNNNSDNLEWKDQYYNVHHAIANGLINTDLSKDPEKLNKIADALEANEKTLREISEEFGVSKGVLSRLKNGSYSDIVGERIYPFHEPLTDKELKEIFELTRKDKRDFKEVAEIYGTSPRTVREIYYANSSSFSERLSKMGCVVTEWKISKPLSDQDAIEIFDKFNGDNMEDLAVEYETTLDTVKKVIHGLARYGNLLRANGRYPKDYSKNLDEEVICNIYKECRAKKKPYQQIAEENGIHLTTVRKIGCAMRGYKDILERNGIKVEKREGKKMKKPGMSFEQAKEIYDEAISGKGSRQIASERHIDRGVVDDIKFCRNAYEFLQTEYGLEPMQKKQN